MNEKIENVRVSSEYSEESAHYGQKFRLKCTSEMITVTGGAPFEPASGFSENADGDVSFSVKPGRISKERDTVEMTALADITSSAEGRIEVVYNDAVDPDEPPVKTTVSFDPADPGFVTLERRGVLRSVMFFEEGKFHRCEYITPFLTIEMQIHSHKVKNRLTPEGGTLELDYAIEMKGADTQRVKMTLEVTKIRKD